MSKPTKTFFVEFEHKGPFIILKRYLLMF